MMMPVTLQKLQYRFNGFRIIEVNRQDFEIAQMLREEFPALYVVKMFIAEGMKKSDAMALVILAGSRTVEDALNYHA